MTQTTIINQPAVDEWGDDPRIMEHLSEEELLEFANKIRKAGGAELIDALLPSQPNDPTSCLIANALNFTSVVQGGDHFGQKGYEVPQYPAIGHHETHSEFSTRLDQYFKKVHNDIVRNPSGDATWVMKTTPERAEKISTALDLNWSISRNGDVGNIELPEHVGNCAFLFDRGHAFQTYAKPGL